jgi:hypothetical protein
MSGNPINDIRRRMLEDIAVTLCSSVCSGLSRGPLPISTVRSNVIGSRMNPVRR